MNLANASVSPPAHTGGFCFEPRASIGAGGVVNFDRRVRNQGVSKWPCSVLLSECSRQYGFLSCWARRFLARVIIAGLAEASQVRVLAGLLSWFSAAPSGSINLAAFL